jgi:hypothetical protein
LSVNAVAVIVGRRGDRPLRVGDEVVARVAEAPSGGGTGLLSIAGALQRARLPAGLERGQTLRLRVTGARASGAVVLALVREGEPGDPGGFDAYA